MIDLTQERDVETLRQISLLLERENQPLITKTLQLTAELARVRGLPNPEQLTLAELHALEQRRAELLAPATDTPSPAKPSPPPPPGHGPRPARGRRGAGRLPRATDTPSPAKPSRPPRPGHGPRSQPTLPVVDIHHELPLDQRACPACGGALTEMTGQTEDAERITTVKLTYQVEHHRRHKYRCACNGAVVTAPGPTQVVAGGRYAPEFGVGVAVAKY